MTLPSAAPSPTATSPMLPVIRLLGVPITNVDFTGAVDHIAAAIAARRGGWVITPNLDILRRFVKDREFADLCEPSSMRLADGMPLVWASRLRGTPLPERVAGSDLIWRLCQRAARDGHRVFFLGGNQGAAEAAAAKLRSEYTGLILAGTECPEPGFDRDDQAVRQLCERVVAAQPDIVLVALGSPKQEKLIRRLVPLLPAAWFLGIGITFSFVSGEVKRAPEWMRNVGLEWVHRLIQEPGRLGKRYLVHGIPFAIRLLCHSALEGVGVVTRR